MPRVNIPIVGLVEFPDSMSREEVGQAARKLYAEAQPPGSRGWREQRREEGLDVGEQQGPAVPGSPRWMARMGSEGLDAGAGNVPPPLPPVAGRGPAAAALRGAMRTGASLGYGAEAVQKAGTFREPGGDIFGREAPPTTGEQIGSIVGGVAPLMALPPQLYASPGAAMSTGGILAGLMGREPGEHIQTQDITNIPKGMLFGLAGQQVGARAERGLKAMGPAVAQGAKRLWRGATGGVDDATEAVMRRAENLGFRRTRGQLPGASRGAQTTEAALSRSPFSGGSYAKIAEHNQRTGNTIAAGQLGLPAKDIRGVQRAVTSLPSERLGQASKGINRLYDQALEGKTLRADDDFWKAAASVDDEARAAFSYDPARLRRYEKWYDKGLGVISKTDDTIDGHMYNTLRSDLGAEVRKIYKGSNPDHELAEALTGWQQVLDSAAARTLPEESAKLLNQARQRWRWLVELEKPGVIGPRGDVSLPRLHNNLNKGSKFYKRGLQQFGDNMTDLEVAARFGGSTTPITGTSFTAENLSAYAPLATGSMGAMSGFMYGDSLNDRLRNAAIGFGAGYALPKLGAIPGAMLSQTAGQRLGNAPLSGMLPQMTGRAATAPLVMTPEEREKFGMLD